MKNLSEPFQYSFESAQRELSNEYQCEQIWMEKTFWMGISVGGERVKKNEQHTFLPKGSLPQAYTNLMVTAYGISVGYWSVVKIGTKVSDHFTKFIPRYRRVEIICFFDSHLGSTAFLPT